MSHDINPVHQIDDRELNRVENGAFFLGDEQFNSIQCAHCGIHWQHKPGSGNVRGYCTRCHKPVCGASYCIHECVPYEAQLEIQEGNRRALEMYRDAEETLAHLFPEVARMRDEINLWDKKLVMRRG